MARVVSMRHKPSQRNKCRRTVSRTRTHITLISIVYENAYKQENIDIDKAIATLQNGKNRNLREKYKKYLEIAY